MHYCLFPFRSRLLFLSAKSLARTSLNPAYVQQATFDRSFVVTLTLEAATAAAVELAAQLALLFVSVIADVIVVTTVDDEFLSFLFVLLPYAFGYGVELLLISLPKLRYWFDILTTIALDE